jgi:peptidoglycan hydrolase CwlO-like protein
MNWFEEQRRIAERQIAVMVEDQKHEVYEHSLEEAVRSLMHKLDERDQEIAALRQKIQSLTKEEVTSG